MRVCENYFVSGERLPKIRRAVFYIVTGRNLTQKYINKIKGHSRKMVVRSHYIFDTLNSRGYGYILRQ